MKGAADLLWRFMGGPRGAVAMSAHDALGQKKIEMARRYAQKAELTQKMRAL